MSRRFAPSRTPAKAKPKAFPLEGSIGRHRCELPGPLHFPSGSTPECRKSVRIGQMPMPKDVKQVRALMGGINYFEVLITAKFCTTGPRGSVRSTRFSARGLSFCSRPLWKKLVREILAELATPPILVFPNWTLSPTDHVRSTCTTTLALTGLAPPSNRSSRTVPCNPSRISAELC